MLQDCLGGFSVQAVAYRWSLCFVPGFATPAAGFAQCVVCLAARVASPVLNFGCWSAMLAGMAIYVYGGTYGNLFQNAK